MFIRLAAALVLMLSAFSLQADQAEKPAITETIQNQLNAFQSDDFERAFTFASPLIKQIFKSPQNFGAMVQQGYPMVHRPADVRFLELREVAGALYQKVQLRDASGEIHLLDYQMVKGENGWEINGVQLLKNAGVSA